MSTNSSGTIAEPRLENLNAEQLVAVLTERFPNASADQINRISIAFSTARAARATRRRQALRIVSGGRTAR